MLTYFSGGVAPQQVANSQIPAMVVRTEGSDAICGCPCCSCCITTIQFQKQYFIPPETGGRISQEEFDRILKEGNEILQNTHIPVIPTIFMHFCIPFSPICIITCYANRPCPFM